MWGVRFSVPTWWNWGVGTYHRFLLPVIHFYSFSSPFISLNPRELPCSVSLCHPVTLLTKQYNYNLVTTTPHPQSPNIAWPRRSSLPWVSVLYGKGLISCWLHLLRLQKYLLSFLAKDYQCLVDFNCPWFCQCCSLDIDQTIGQFWTDFSYQLFRRNFV